MPVATKQQHIELDIKKIKEPGTCLPNICLPSGILIIYEVCKKCEYVKRFY